MVSGRSRQRRLSASKSRKAKAAGSDGGEKKGYKNAVITTMITLLIGGVFGDLIIKRNVQGFNQARAAYENAPAEASKQFNETRKLFNRRIAERRRKTERIVGYIRDDDVQAFHAYFENYDQEVSAWNSDLNSIAEKILEVTRCSETFKDASTSERNDAFSETFDAQQKLHNDDEFLQSLKAKTKLARAHFLSEKRYCPTFFLTKSGRFSVHERFRLIHDKVAGFRADEHARCRLRHIQNLNSYYQSCLQKYEGESAGACTRRYDSIVESAGFCGEYESARTDHAIEDIEFDELDFYWGLGNDFFGTFRKDFMVRECRSRLNFWGAVFSWNCEEAVTEYLSKQI